MATVSTIGRRLLTPLIVTSLLAGLGAAALPVAQAAPEWNSYSVAGIPEYVTAPTPFTVSIDGPDAVCSMDFDGTVRTAPPWTFTLRPETDYLDAGRMSAEVAVTECGGAQDRVSVEARVPFTFPYPVLPPADRGKTTATVAAWLDGPATLTVTDRTGKVLVTKRVPTTTPMGRATSVTIPVGRAATTQRLRMTMASAQGLTMSQDVVVPSGWAVISNFYYPLDATVPNCSRLTWSYQTAGEPGRASTLERDLAPALRRLERETGLTFQRVPVSQNADIRFTWKNLGANGPSGLGGTDGGVILNSNPSNFWVGNAYRGFGRIGGTPGRGWLIVHEVMHTLGFFHVNDRQQVMNALAYAAQFGNGDLAGLHTLYPQKACR